ncbi:hypothetical protein ACM01_35000 [Streptomyces viridochromogenes]|uniref:Uncharacterized protein n=1 Tax=Streptomyces viridochromogenes TaxID=1938 RepID=A0A0J7Z0Q2_STRVR|nr:hypothetical protein ACM01_35000 [Streptomyces viridochromogenes]
MSGCGTQNATADQTPAGEAVPSATPLGASPSAGDPELRFLEVMRRILQGCAPDAPDGSGGAPKPEDLPGYEGEPTPRYGPGETPPSVPGDEADTPVPADSTGPRPVKEVPLTGAEKCNGSEHAERVSGAFKNTRTSAYEAIHRKLTDLDYPASRIHQMPDHAGAPRARLDLRLMGGHLALEITGTGNGVIVEAFGAPETEDVKVTDVRRKQQLDAPTS